MPSTAYHASLSELRAIRRQLQAGQLAPEEVETLIGRALTVLETGRGVLRRVEAVVEAVDL